MEKTITTAILTIAAVMVALVLVNAMVPSSYTSSRTAAAVTSRLDTRMRTDLTIVHVAAETVGDQNYVRIWLKNTGLATIDSIPRLDVVLAGSSGSKLYPHGTGQGKWQYAILSDGQTEWSPGATLRLDLQVAAPLTGMHTAVVTTPTGVQVKDTFSL